MRGVLLFLIRQYWRVSVALPRRNCLFRETCSRHVYRVTSEEGVIPGIRALAVRVRRCRGGYAIVANHFICRDGAVVPWSEVNFAVAPPHVIG
jgi:putative component of membrane protein insertase Oxa1/YidC/SpoIIIJ protein YidD